jgi:hypothetical protein
MRSLPDLFALLVAISISRMTRKRKRKTGHECHSILQGGMNTIVIPAKAGIQSTHQMEITLNLAVYWITRFRG